MYSYIARCVCPSICTALCSAQLLVYYAMGTCAVYACRYIVLRISSASMPSLPEGLMINNFTHSYS